MTNILNRMAIAGIATGALFVSGAAFVPGTAEAHCGDHQQSCSAYGEQFVYAGTYCGDFGGLYCYWIDRYDYYTGYCNTPAAGCSGPACQNWPCADGQCESGQAHGCLSDSQYNTGYEFCAYNSAQGCML